MPSRTEFKQAFRRIGDEDYRSHFISVRGSRISVWFDRKDSFKRVVDETIKRIDSERWYTWTYNVESASKNILAYWSGVIDDTFRAHEASGWGSEDYDGRWIKVGDEELRLTVERIEGPVDVTRYRVQRRTIFEESELVFDLDEQGRIEEVLNPLCITNRLRDHVGDKLGEVGVEHEIKYRHGGIDVVKIVETQRDPEDNAPTIIVKTTEFRIPPLI